MPCARAKYASTSLDPDAPRRRVLDFVRRLIQARSAREPVVRPARHILAGPAV
jgi:hypothetical protein